MASELATRVAVPRRGRGILVSPDAIGACQHLWERLTAVLASKEPGVRRLRYAHSSVRFVVLGGSQPVALLLDGADPRLTDDGEPTEIEIELTPEQAALFATGELPMPAAILSGEVRCRGPVRKYLEIDAILRGLLTSANGDHRSSSDAAAVRVRRVMERIDPDLLAIETRGLRKSFGPHVVLARVDLAIPEGVISVVLGPSGTGKSVLLKHIIGLMAPDAGEVLVRGRRLTRMSRSELLALRRDIGVMFQDGALFSAMNLFDNVAFPLRQHTDLAEAEIREVVMDHLASVGLADAARRFPNELSGGMRKRAGLARSFVLEPGIVLCDEPDSGLDPVRTALLGDLLVAQHARYGGTIVVVTHNVALARQISDHVSILWHGEVLEADLTDAVYQSNTPFVRQFLSGETMGPLGMDA